MSKKLHSDDIDFELDEKVEFTGPDGNRLTGLVVRVYNTRDDYHVEVDGERYSVNRRSDNMRYAPVPAPSTITPVTTGYRSSWTDEDRAAQSRRILGQDARCQGDCSRGGDGPPCCLPGCQG